MNIFQVYEHRFVTWDWYGPSISRKINPLVLGLQILLIEWKVLQVRFGSPLHLALCDCTLWNHSRALKITVYCWHNVTSESHKAAGRRGWVNNGQSSGHWTRWHIQDEELHSVALSFLSYNNSFTGPEVILRCRKLEIKWIIVIFSILVCSTQQSISAEHHNKWGIFMFCVFYAERIWSYKIWG